ncbi:MAG: hypothetical protein MUO77_09320 [Anaerolineales bacterium]|nr:hypothetical protein [Anaerolineales bacterium]
MKKLIIILLGLLVLIACVFSLRRFTSYLIQTVTPTPPVTITPTYEGCYYVWANQNLPEVTEKLEAAIRKLQSTASANASAFGEDCVYADGHSTFGAMETDFYVTLSIESRGDEDAMGDWIAQVMPVIDQLTGFPGGSGFVEFTFQDNEPSPLIVRVPVYKYKNEVQGLSGAELFRLFYTTP